MNQYDENWILNAQYFSVFPLRKDSKKPIGAWKKYQENIAGDNDIVEWVAQRNNIGVVTGKISGVIVLDLDNDEAINDAINRGIPQTWMVKTPRGRHVYFKYPEFPIKNAVGDGLNLPKGMDIRGDGGYVVGAGSYYKPNDDERAAGKKEGAYEWIKGHEPDEFFTPAEMPSWLVEIVKAKPVPVLVTPAAPTSGQSDGESPYGRAALERECEALREAQSGGRNHQLNKSAYAIAGLVAGGELDEWQAKIQLTSAAVDAGLPQSEITKTLTSAFSAGSRQPRSAPEDDIRRALADIGAPAAPVDTRPLNERFFANLKPANELTNREIPEREYLIDGWLPVGAVTTLFGDGGLGKSLIAMQMATAVSAGQSVWGCETTKAPVLSIYCEDDEDELARRQSAITGELQISSSEQSLNFIQSRFGEDSSLGHLSKGEWKRSDFLSAIEEKAKEVGARLVVIDNISLTFTGDANDSGQVTRFISSLNRLALEINGAVLLLGHIAKSEGSKFSGSTAWSNASRNRLLLARHSDSARNPDIRVLSVEKSNYGKTGESIDLYYNFGAFCLTSEVVGEVKQAQEQLLDEQYFLRHLEDFTSRRVAVSVKHNARNYAPRVFSKATLPVGVRRRTESEFARAMARLLNRGIIAENELLGWKTEQRKDVRGLKQMPDITLPAVNREIGKSTVDSLLDSLRVGAARNTKTPNSDPRATIARLNAIGLEK